MTSVRERGISFLNSKVKVFILACVTICTLVFDTSIINVYYINFNQLSLGSKYIVFIVIAIISILGQFFLFEFVRYKSAEIRRINLLGVNSVHKILLVFQAIIILLFLAIILEMITESAYHVDILVASIVLNYGAGVFLLSLLSSRFFSWFKADKNHVVLLYGLSFSCIAANMVFTSVLVVGSLANKPDLVLPHFGFVSSSFGSGTTYDFLRFGYVSSMIGGFILSWISTIFLLRQFSITWKRQAHWSLLILPMLYFLIQFNPMFGSFLSSYFRADPVFIGILYALFVTYSKPIGGILFGVAFLAITRSLSRKNIAMEYTTISAYGFVLLFVSNQAFVLSSAPYPPFGLATINMIGLACYMLLVGIFASAISLSQDIRLRGAIRKAIQRKSNLLSSIAISQITADVQKETVEVYQKTRKKIFEEIGIGPTMSISEAKDYCNKVMDELKKREHQNKR